MHIVFPDAGSNVRGMLSGALEGKIKNIADFVIYEGSPKSDEEFIKRIKDADGLMLGKYLPNEVMKECNKLKVISFVGYGVKNYVDIEFATKCGITIANTPDYGNNAVAEHALSLMLSLSKNIVENHNKLKKGMWDKSVKSIELKGKVIGLVGIGGIGQRMAELCKALGMEVISWTFNPSQERSKKLGIQFVTLDYLFSKSDFISLHLPYTNQTKNIIDEKHFSLIKQSAILINTARSQLIEKDALDNALRNGLLAGAGLDVFDEEPLPKSDDLLEKNNLILSPHVGYNTPESIKNMMNIATYNLLNYFKGLPINKVN